MLNQPDSWNDLLGPLIFLNTDKSYTFPIALTRFKHHVSGQYMWTLVCAGAFDYVSSQPDNRLLHVWAADVFGGAWCSCGDCARR